MARPPGQRKGLMKLAAAERVAPFARLPAPKVIRRMAYKRLEKETEHLRELLREELPYLTNRRHRGIGSRACARLKALEAELRRRDRLARLARATGWGLALAVAVLALWALVLSSS